MVFMGAITSLQAMSDSFTEVKEEVSPGSPQLRGWAHDMMNRRLGDDDFVSPEELAELNEEYRQRRFGNDTQDNQTNEETLAYQAEESTNSEEQAQLSLLAQWQRFFMEIMAYFYGK